MNLSNENRLLLFCAQNKITEDKMDQIKKLLSLSLNWEEVLRSAFLHGIAQLLYHNLNKIQESHFIPKGVMNKLKKAYHVNAFRNMYFYEALNEILEAFRKKGISVIVLKGAALSKTVYGNIGLRPMDDIDLLVNKENLHDAEKIMFELSYTPDEGDHSKEWYRKNHHHLAPYDNIDNWITIEIHHDIIHIGNPFCIDICKMWERSQIIKIGEIDIRVLSPEDLIVHLCLHLSSYGGHFVGRIRDLADIARVVKFYGKRINWDLLVRDAQENNFTDYVYYPLYLAKDILEMEIEKDILKMFKNNSNLRPFEDRILKLIVKKNILLRDGSSSIFPVWIFQTLCKELLRKASTHNKIGYLLRVILLPSNWSITKKPHISFQKPSYIFYPILRLQRLIFLLFIKLGRNILNIISHKIGVKSVR